MKLSYLVTCSTETKTLMNLLKVLKDVASDKDELVILLDKEHANEKNETYNMVGAFHHSFGHYIDASHELNADYGSHKNYGNSKCTGDYIFQIDGDELPPEALLGDNLRAIIEINPAVELIYVPRINDFKGVTEEHAKSWGWRLTPSLSCENRPVVNLPDYQGRIYKNVPDRIKWDRKLHEKIEGHKEYSFLPAEEDYALYHDKTIEKQIETNMRYNKTFTEDENRGHKVA